MWLTGIEMICCTPLCVKCWQDKVLAWREPGFCGPVPQQHRCLVPDKAHGLLDNCCFDAAKPIAIVAGCERLLAAALWPHVC
jgi:hypothetical protein